jgi:polar amino acid transport system substrate-binding protein
MGDHSKRALAVAWAALLALILTAAPAAAQDGDQLDYLGRIKQAGRIVMSTDALYKPQSFIDENGVMVGFDIDVGQEIADRLGVTFVPYPIDWASVASGRWLERWDFSVGSMTPTVPRKERIDFTRPYYSNPVTMSARADLGYTSMDDLAGKTVCVGEATTYFDWLNGQLDLGEFSDQYIPADSVPPADVQVTTRETDTICASEWGQGLQQFEGWLTSGATTDAAIESGVEMTKLDELVFLEPLAVAFDNSIEDNDSLVAAVDQIIGDMQEDGTLSELSMKWFGEDLTQGLSE